MDSPGKLLTVEDLAKKWQVPKSWIYQRTRKRGVEKLEHAKLGKYVRFEEEAMSNYIKDHRTGLSLDKQYKIGPARKSGRANGKRR